MPDHTIRVPDLPWLQSFAPGDRVRVIDSLALGTVIEHTNMDVPLPVEVNIYGVGHRFYPPGELRPL